MNYRHAYHAGNFADVLKHTVLLLCIQYLQRKDAPLCFVDTHGGAGLYDLGAEEARRTGEWESGIGRLLDRTDAPAGLQPYLAAIRDYIEHGKYPGSPLLIAGILRPQDRLITSELHAGTYDVLESALLPYANVRTMHIDAYECARSHLPPKERRGLVLVDPPYEKKDEFSVLARQMKEWKKRWPTGVYMVWYPIKAHLPVAALHEMARELGLHRTWFAEILVFPRNEPSTFNGCGMIVFNAPYSVPESVEALLPFLKDAMGLHATASGWLTPPA